MLITIINDKYLEVYEFSNRPNSQLGCSEKKFVCITIKVYSSILVILFNLHSPNYSR